MAASRQDAWSEDEDLLLAEIVLRHIREGSTQLAAFQEVGGKLSRTAAACGFRWNSAIRKTHQQAIELAKKQRKSHASAENHSEKQDVNEVEEPVGAQRNDQPVWEEAIERIRHELDVLSQKLAVNESGRSEKGITEEHERETARLKTVNQELEGELKKLIADYRLMEEDYKALIKIMERARKMVFLQNDENTSFKMDMNGNLQQVKK
ncbi:RsfA family transcriptional regulator [Bacillus marinisedimentorum]|uniref:RsfA family transcriptional regulator n=1 Tax=Bacillus marinisedimentorum TaxID=1821260 RepID=UPI0008726CCE